MPTYTFRHPRTKEVKDIILRMSEPHEYVDAKGTKWERVFFAPNASVDTHINPMSAKDFVEKTGKKRGTIGDLWDKSAELSAKRAKQLGIDPVKEKAVNDYAKKCHGKRHPHADQTN